MNHTEEPQIFKECCDIALTEGVRLGGCRVEMDCHGKNSTTNNFSQVYRRKQNENTLHGMS